MTAKFYAIALFAGLMGTLMIWGFIAGWAGEIRFLPDRPLEIGGLVFILIMYAPIAFSVWAAWGLVTNNSQESAND